MVKVLNVDDGDEMEAPLDCLRLLPIRFMRHHMLGVTVKLSDVGPPSRSQEDCGGVWDEASAVAVAHYLSDLGDLSAFVEKSGASGRSVVLYEHKEGRLVCVVSTILSRKHFEAFFSMRLNDFYISFAERPPCL